MDFQQEHAELEKIIKKSYHLLFLLEYHRNEGDESG